MNGIRSSLGVSINLKHVLELHEFSVHKIFPLEANSRMRISIWDLEYRIRVISAAQILNALMNRLHPIPSIPRLRAVSYHSTLRAHVKSERRSREEREWKLSLHPNLSSFLPLICIILLFRSPRVALRQKKNEPPFAV